MKLKKLPVAINFVLLFVACSCQVSAANHMLTGNTPLVTDSIGTFTDDGGENGDYSWGIYSKQMTFTSKKGGKLSFNFDEFKTIRNEIVIPFWLFLIPFPGGYHTGIYYGHELRVYDGPSTSSPLIGKYMGDVDPGTITSSCNSMTFVFSNQLSQIVTFFLSDDWLDLLDTEEGWAADFMELPATPHAGIANSICQDGANLSWQSDGCNLSYQVKLSTSSSFSTSTDFNAQSNSLALLNLLPNKNYYWKAKVLNGPWSVVYNFKTLGAPNSPIAVTCYTSADLSWESICSKSGNMNYVIRYGTNSTLNNYMKDSVKNNTQLKLVNLTSNTLYYYKIYANNYSSQTFSFKTNPALDSVDIQVSKTCLQSTNLTSVNVNIINNCANSTKRIQISEDSLFSTFFYNSTTTLASTLITNLALSKKYFVRVGLGNTPNVWTKTKRFTTIDFEIKSINASNICATSATINWQGECLNFINVTTPTYFFIQMSTSPTFTNPLNYSVNTTSVNKLTPINLTPNTKYYYHICYSSPGTWQGQFSPTYTFTTCDGGVIQAMAKNVCSNKADIEWNGPCTSCNDLYTLNYSLDSTFQTKTTLTSSTNKASLTNLVSGKKYFYTLGISGSTFNKYSFYTIPLGVELLTPIDTNIVSSADSSSIFFNWRSYDCPPSTYNLQVSTDSTFNTKVTNVNGITASQLTKKVASGFIYFWRVKLYNGTTWGNWSPIKKFSTTPTVIAGSTIAVPCGTAAILEASGGINYSWSPALGLNNPNIAKPICNPPYTTTYTVTITNSNGTTSTAATTIKTGLLKADAGPDVTIASNVGSTKLNGTYSGGSYVNLSTSYMFSQSVKTYSPITG